MFYCHSKKVYCSLRLSILPTLSIKSWIRTRYSTSNLEWNAPAPCLQLLLIGLPGAPIPDFKMVAHSNHRYFIAKLSKGPQLGRNEHSPLSIQIYLTGARKDTSLKVAQLLACQTSHQFVRFLIPAIYGIDR